MCDVARRNGVKEQELSDWRSRSRRGELALPGSQASAFVTVEVEPERDLGPDPARAGSPDAYEEDEQFRKVSARRCARR